MKFQVREGFSVQTITKVDMGEGRIESQANNYYAGQLVEMDVATAEQHAHKLEPKDKEGAAWLAAKVISSPKPESVSASDVARLVAEQVAAQMTTLMAAMMGKGQAPAAAADAGSKAPAA